MIEFTYPEWQPALHAAIRELDPQDLKEKVSAAEYAILKRLFEIAGISAYNEERQALQGATNTLLALKRKRLEQPMRCKVCGSVSQNNFIGEMGIRSPGLKNIDKPTVWVFPELIVCLDCGTAEFVVPEDELAELRLLAKGDSAASA